MIQLSKKLLYHYRIHWKLAYIAAKKRDKWNDMLTIDITNFKPSPNHCLPPTTIDCIKHTINQFERDN